MKQIPTLQAALFGVTLLVLLPTVGQAQNYYGNVDSSNCSTINGWARDTIQPNTPISVDLYNESIPLVSVIAGNFRQDLVNAGIGNGYHGFSIPTPNSLKDGQLDHIYAYFSGTTMPLYFSGVTGVNCSAPSAGYQPYYSDSLSTVDTTKWTQNGPVSTGSTGLTSSAAAGGALISKVAVPDGSSSYEVRATLGLTGSGGNFYLYFRASSNAQADANLGSYYAVQLSAPTFSGGVCLAALNVIRTQSGVATVLSSRTVTCHTGMVLRAVITSSNLIVYYIDSVNMGVVADSALTSGQPGVGVSAAPAGNTITQMALGPLDRVAPGAVNAQGVSTTAAPNRVDFQWQGAADDSIGTGIAFYSIYRGSSWVGMTMIPTLSDSAVSPGTTYTYLIQSYDFHFNLSNTYITVTTPPTASLEHREVGIRPTGSYWGGAGEQIDMRSGNLNFSIPLTKAQGRGGWGVGFVLSYNSQNWKQDPGATWQYGHDVGYGYGWRLQAGSLTPIYQYYVTVHHYLFVDATGAEYRLDQNNAGVWTSLESIHVAYDSSTQRLYFPDGSFWVFGSTSAGTEQDSGAQYPTLMQDTNGNQVMVRYYGGLGTTWANSSARIQQIEDTRAVQTNGTPTYQTYDFNFNTDPVPHLVSIINTIGTGEKYTFSYTTGMLNSPFSPSQPFGNQAFLQSIARQKKSWVDSGSGSLPSE